MGGTKMRNFIIGTNGLTSVEKQVANCWINVEIPTQEDIRYLTEELKIPHSFIHDIEDVDERPRIEYENDWQLIIIRIPIRNNNEDTPFYTIPLGIIFKDDVITTLCYYKTEMIADFISYNNHKGIGFSNKFDLVLKLLLSSAVWYLKYLKQLNNCIRSCEKELEKSIKNRELQSLLKIEKCFVYFITALKGNAILLTRIKGRAGIDSDLLEDVEIEMKQALETANVHSDILSGMMDAYASVIGNNMNNIMKQLTLISIIMMIPTLIASFYGMNVPNALQDNPHAIAIILSISLIVSAACAWLFKLRKIL
ncbi:magnesium transporter CorA family protein [Coprobacter sp. LH1063]|uniref:Magnesium transporter CorA family protein n=2 Tax=Coprobacter tertius TaxID=2944915 RepID=A0ABT1MDQ9_9BACT|nr:magnesium transporter CorA family protein [Coprobacter tertius]MCP9610773.1 magnesium transporter CorA family protein [Coprobacter tertius]